MPVVLRYAGPAFDDLAEAYAGWMLLDLTTREVSVAAPARRHARVRGATLVDDPAAASITVGTGRGCTCDALHPEKLLADLL